MADKTLADDRRAISDARFETLRARTAETVADLELSNLTIICAGSFARGEGGPHSDVDLFFAYTDDGLKAARPRTTEMRLFGRLIELIDELGFPPFSRDASFLVTSNAEQLAKHFGAPEDDVSNFFTLRMLMLLESRCLFNDSTYESIRDRMLEPYCHDVEKHQDDFEPWAMINDIVRYWRTLLLNYENVNIVKRAGDPELEEDVDAERRIRKFKLKFSRATTCFATIAAIASQESPHSMATLTELTALTPRERLSRVANQMPETAPLVGDLLADYAWFLEQTSLSKDDLRQSFADGDTRTERRSRGAAYGDKLFALIQEIDGRRPAPSRSLMRHLVI